MLNFFNGHRKTITMKKATQLTQQYITVNGIKYHYAEAGKGPLVILTVSRSYGIPGGISSRPWPKRVIMP